MYRSKRGFVLWCWIIHWTDSGRVLEILSLTYQVPNTSIKPSQCQKYIFFNIPNKIWQKQVVGGVYFSGSKPLTSINFLENFTELYAVGPWWWKGWVCSGNGNYFRSTCAGHCSVFTWVKHEYTAVLNCRAGPYEQMLSKLLSFFFVVFVVILIKRVWPIFTYTSKHHSQHHG